MSRISLVELLIISLVFLVVYSKSSSADEFNHELANGYAAQFSNTLPNIR